MSTSFMYSGTTPQIATFREREREFSFRACRTQALISTYHRDRNRKRTSRSSCTRSPWIAAWVPTVFSNRTQCVSLEAANVSVVLLIACLGSFPRPCTRECILVRFRRCARSSTVCHSQRSAKQRTRRYQDRLDDSERSERVAQACTRTHQEDRRSTSSRIGK